MTYLLELRAERSVSEIDFVFTQSARGTVPTCRFLTWDTARTSVSSGRGGVRGLESDVINIGCITCWMNPTCTAQSAGALLASVSVGPRSRSADATRDNKSVKACMASGSLVGDCYSWQLGPGRAPAFSSSNELAFRTRPGGGACTPIPRYSG